MSLVVSKNPLSREQGFDALDVEAVNRNASEYRMVFNKMTLIADGSNLSDFVGLIIPGYRIELDLEQRRALRRNFLDKVFSKTPLPPSKMLFVGDFFPFSERDIPLNRDIYWLDDTDDYGFLVNLDQVGFINFGRPVTVN